MSFCPTGLSRAVTNWLYLAGLVLMWGTAFLFIKISVATIPPATAVAGRLLLAALILIAVVSSRARALPRDRNSWQSFVTIGVIGNALPFFLITWGEREVDSALAGILMAVAPLATLVLAHFYVAGERINAGKALGFLLGFGGLLVLLGPEAAGPVATSQTELLSQGAILLGALCYAVTMIVARNMPRTDAIVASAGVMIVSTLIMLPVALLHDRPWTLSPSPASLAAVLVLGVFATALPTILYFKLIASAGPTFLSLINYLIPVMAVVAGVLVLGERLEWTALVALALILAGIALTRFARTAPRREEVPRAHR